VAGSADGPRAERTKKEKPLFVINSRRHTGIPYLSPPPPPLFFPAKLRLLPPLSLSVDVHALQKKIRASNRSAYIQIATEELALSFTLFLPFSLSFFLFKYRLPPPSGADSSR